MLQNLGQPKHGQHLLFIRRRMLDLPLIARLDESLRIRIPQNVFDKCTHYQKIDTQEEFHF